MVNIARTEGAAHNAIRLNPICTKITVTVRQGCPQPQERKLRHTESGTTLRRMENAQNLSEVQDSLLLSPLSNEASPNRPPVISESHGDAQRGQSSE